MPNTPRRFSTVDASVPPSVSDSMRHENSRPVGIMPPFSEMSAGTHMKTNEYMPPSKKAWLRPSSIMPGLTLMARDAVVMLSLISCVTLLLASSELDSPVFSGQNHTSTSTTIVSAMASWNGPMSPLMSAETCATRPARMAVIPKPAELIANVLSSSSSGKPRLRCSVTIQLSKAVKSSEVEMPPRMRPTHSVQNS